MKPKKPSSTDCATMLPGATSFCWPFAPALSTGSRPIPTGAWACSLKATWSGFFPSRRADQTRRRVSTSRPCAISSSAHSSSMNVAHFEALYAAAERWPALRARYASWFDGVRLDSPEVAQARAQQEQLRALENDRPPPDRARPSQPNSRAAGGSRGGPLAGLVAAHLLLDADAGEPRLSGTSSTISSPTMPGWGEADETLRRRIVASAERYLAEAETSIDAWLGHEPMPVYRE